MLTFEFSDKNPDAPVAYASFGAMHTVMEMVMATPDRNAAQVLAEEICESITALDKTYNRFSENSGVAAVNRMAAKGYARVDGELYMIFEMCGIFRQATEGYFDIGAACGMPLPLDDQRYILDPEKRAVRFTPYCAGLDLGGFAKGYAVDKAAGVLKNAGVERALLNFGDSSVSAIGTHPHGGYWPVGVAGPGGTGASLHDFRLKDNALSVSGVNGHDREHIIDPRTGLHVKAGGMVAVEGKSALIAEILSTALYAAPGGARGVIMGRFEGYHAYELDLAGVGGRIA